MPETRILRVCLVVVAAALGVAALPGSPVLDAWRIPEARALQLEPAQIEGPDAKAKAPSGDGADKASLEAEEGSARDGGDAKSARNDDAKNAQGGGSKKDGGAKPIAAFSMIMSAVAGLVLFIFGVSQLAQGLTDLNSERMRRVLAKLTTNRFAGVGTGAVATTLLESSSVTIIMTIAMVSSGVLTFVQSLGVVLGANIGTAVGAQIIALDIEQYIPMLMLSGLLLAFLGKIPTYKKLGLVVLGFGLMFYGLEAIDTAMKPLRTHQPFIEAMSQLGKTPLLGALVGAAFTVAVQSSSATVAVVITLAGSGLISLPAGIAIMLGAEIGTCADTLVATVGRGRPALRTGAFHLAFNLTTACVGIALAPLFVALVQRISGNADVGHQIANAQILFNIAGVCGVLPFLPWIAKGLEKLIPDARAQHHPSQEPMAAE